jgi:hypothetical protein
MDATYFTVDKFYKKIFYKVLLTFNNKGHIKRDYYPQLRHYLTKCFVVTNLVNYVIVIRKFELFSTPIHYESMNRLVQLYIFRSMRYRDFPMESNRNKSISHFVMT